MLRRLLAVSIIVVSVAACGGNSPTASPSAAPESPAPSSAPATSPSGGPEATPTPATTTTTPTTMKTACTSTAIRDSASLSGKLLARVSLGVKVEVVEVITGDPYTTGACGTSGDTWLKIDKVQGKKTKKLYGVPFAYAAAGLFE
jgi:hypothetical protein